MTAALPALTANLALELASVRLNLIAAGFVDTQLSASLLGDELENRQQPASSQTSHPAGCSTSRCRRTSGTHHDQHRGNLRRRRRPAVRRRPAEQVRRVRKNLVLDLGKE